MRRHRDRRFAATALCSGAFALLLCAIVDGVMRAIVSPFPSPVVLLDDAARLGERVVASLPGATLGCPDWGAAEAVEILARQAPREGGGR